MARSIRMFWSNRTYLDSGWYNVGWSGVINEYSVVHISVIQGYYSLNLGDDRHSIHHDKENNNPIPVITVSNVAPHGNTGGVNFYLRIGGLDNPNPKIDIVTDINQNQLLQCFSNSRTL
ncbi:hypothetical protein [Bacillus cereus]|uniref:hypothetical protein n=1 Tax=Bacillus cereus TaxID=1396 RepID=UPI0014439E9C|nr:hypothetical protein [Bacillus cereus]